jgi:hypothetical protein
MEHAIHDIGCSIDLMETVDAAQWKLIMLDQAIVVLIFLSYQNLREKI